NVAWHALANVQYPEPLSAPPVIFGRSRSVNRSGYIASGTTVPSEAHQIGIGATPLHVTSVTRRLRQAANFAQLAGLDIDLADRRPAALVGETFDAKRNVFAITTRIEGCGGRTVRQR